MRLIELGVLAVSEEEQMSPRARRLIETLRKQIAAAEATAVEIGKELGVKTGFFGEDGALRLYDRERDDTKDRHQRGAPWDDGGAVIAFFVSKKGMTWDGGGI